MLDASTVSDPWQSPSSGYVAYESIPDATWQGGFTRHVTYAEKRPSFIHVRDSRLKAPDSLINLAVRDDAIRSFLVSAASYGYLQYYGVAGEARLVHRSRIPNTWNPVRLDELSVSPHGIIYTLDSKLPMSEANRLLVIFSGVALHPRSSSLWRYFERNFRHIDSQVPGDTAVLRIADIGGVLGGFYMNTADTPDTEDSIRRLIRDVASQLHIQQSAICLLGSSKGATGAALHGMSMNLPFIAVEPILSDDHYEQHLKDIHFTRGPVFLERKAELFRRLSDERQSGSRRGHLFTSPASPQYPYIRGFTEDTPDLSLLTTKDSRISDHPDVARTVLGPTIALVNAILLDWPLPRHPVNL